MAASQHHLSWQPQSPPISLLIINLRRLATTRAPLLRSNVAIHTTTPSFLRYAPPYWPRQPPKPPTVITSLLLLWVIRPANNIGLILLLVLTSSHRHVMLLPPSRWKFEDMLFFFSSWSHIFIKANNDLTKNITIVSLLAVACLDIYPHRYVPFFHFVKLWYHIMCYMLI